MERKPIGQPKLPPDFRVSKCGHYLISTKKADIGAARRYVLAMHTVSLIQADRQAEQTFVPHVPDHYWARKDGQ